MVNNLTGALLKNTVSVGYMPVEEVSSIPKSSGSITKISDKDNGRAAICNVDKVVINSKGEGNYLGVQSQEIILVSGDRVFRIIPVSDGSWEIFHSRVGEAFSEDGKLLCMRENLYKYERKF